MLIRFASASGVIGRTSFVSFNKPLGIHLHAPLIRLAIALSPRCTETLTSDSPIPAPTAASATLSVPTFSQPSRYAEICVLESHFTEFSAGCARQLQPSVRTGHRTRTSQSKTQIRNFCHFSWVRELRVPTLGTRSRENSGGVRRMLMRSASFNVVCS
jgi:hypothetical protein